MASKKGHILVILLITITLFIYFLFVAWNSSPFIDVWPLEGILWETIATVIIVTMLSWILFQSRAFIIVPLITLVFLVIMIPVLRYPNALNIIGPWDSAAHFSFAKWIIVNGHVDTAGNLYYSREYGFHPGNGIIPVMLSLLSSISLGWSMRIVLVVIYSGYMLFLLATLKALEQSTCRGVNVVKGLWLIAVLTLAVNLSVYYGGNELGRAYAPGILYILLKWLAGKGKAPIKKVIVALLIFEGLILTHLATAVIITIYTLIVVLALFVASLVNERFEIWKSYWGLPVLALLMTLIFVAYAVYVDVFLLGYTLRGALDRIYSLYIKELERASIAMNVKGVTLIDLLQYLISYHAKVVIILGLALIHTVTLLVKWRSLSSNDKTLALLLFASFKRTVIVPSLESLKEIVGEAAIYYTPGNVNDLKKAIIESKTEIDRSSKIIFKKALKYNWESIATKTYKLYQKIL